MPGLTLYLSNRLENLAERLAQIVRQPAGTALQPESIVVQSRGMERWVSMQLARRNGICANTLFPFPNTFLDSVFQRLFTDLPDSSLFEPEMMTLQIMKRLPDLVRMPEFETLRWYLKDDENQLKLYQLSERIAATFDQYMVFRPQMIFTWEKHTERCEPDIRWQPILWREITRGRRDQHRAFLQKELLRHLGNLPVSDTVLPPRINLFGISYLPPFHMQAFAAMAGGTAVNIFLLNPCREYWADILDTRDIQRITRRFEIAEEAEAYYYLEQGNPLLASMGILGRDFLSLISDTECQFADGFEEPACRDMLTCIQADILNLADRGTDRSTGNRLPENTDSRFGQGAVPDDSIQIHVCHSPLREIEVIHDQLLGLFEKQADLQPRDVIVMTPDIEAYAPFIHAVFGSHPDLSSRIPYSISDQSSRRVRPMIDAFLQLLSLKGSRLGVSQIMSVLELTGIKERFGLRAPDVDRIASWISDLNIRWGRDANSRSTLGLPAFAENTWKQGIRRLLLGLAMPDRDPHLFAGILPYGPIEGQDGEVLGKLLDFLEQVFGLSEILERPCRPIQWQDRLIDVLERFFLFDDHLEIDAHQIRQALESIGRMESVGAYDRELPLDVVTAYLEKVFQNNPQPSGFLSGGVTFCAMLPMRSIPFQIVCMVGMNNDAIPRSQQPLGFDLIRRHPQPGDRSRRNDDKYLFLEAILSARQTLYISYVGQSIEDNSLIPPSVLVSELCDYIHRGFGVDEDTIEVRHPLQSFSPRYFQNEEAALLSYSRENYEAIRNRRQDLPPAAFFTSPLPEPPPESRTLSLEQLCFFYHHPVRYLLQQRLSLRLEETMIADQDREPFRLDGLSRHRIGQALSEHGLSGVDLRAHFPVQKATGSLPQGTVGETTYRELSSEAEDFATRVASELQNHKPQHRPLDLQIAEFNLFGMLSDLYPQGRVQYRFARTKARDILSAWIQHLCLRHSADDQYPFRSTLVATDSTLQFKPVEKPGRVLEDLLRIYWEGLQAPLHFFPDLSLEFFHQTVLMERPPADAIKVVQKKWTGSAFVRGHLDDPYIRICFEQSDPLDESFQQLAVRIFRPLFESVEKYR